MTHDAIVIGGGFSGLSAAVRLAQAGLRVLLVEARTVLGGRAYSYRDPVTGEAADNGQHLLAGCYHETRAFLRAVGADALVQFQPSLAVTMVGADGSRTSLTCRSLPSPVHLLSGICEWEALDWHDRLSAVGLAGPLRIASRQARGQGRLAAASPGETVDQWLRRHDQSDRLCAMLWEPLALAALNQPAREAAAPVFARVVGQMFGSDPGDAALGWPRVPLTDAYVVPARAWLTGHGCEIRTGARAAVRIEHARVAAVEVGAERLLAGAVVLAVPWFAIPDSLTGDTTPLADLVSRAHQTSASPIVTVNLWLDRPVIDVPFIGLVGRTWQWVFDREAMAGATTPHLALVASGARWLISRTEDDLVRLAVDDLAGAVPEFCRARIRHASAVRERRATFSLAPSQPARPGTRTPVAGLWLAGDWIDTGLPATIEGAVAAGHRAASAITP